MQDTGGTIRYRKAACVRRGHTASCPYSARDPNPTSSIRLYSVTRAAIGQPLERESAAISPANGVSTHTTKISISSGGRLRLAWNRNPSEPAALASATIMATARRDLGDAGSRMD